ncbi:MAG: sensor domain-containing diguanylate cyclase [Endomicrobiia bacterium]
MIDIEAYKRFFIDILTTIILPVFGGICFVIWIFYFFQYPVITFPTVFIIFLIIYFLSGPVFGGVLLAFTVSAGLFAIAIIDNSYDKIMLIYEIIWMVFVFFRLEHHRNIYISLKRKLEVEHEVLDRDIALIQSAITENEKRSSAFIQRMANFQKFEKIISSLESSMNEHELIKLIEELTSKFISKGKWKTKRFFKKDIFIEYVKTNKIPLLITDTSDDKRFSNNDYKDITSIIVMPIEVEGLYWGYIEGISIIKNIKFNDSDLRLLSVLSNILGIILYNTSLFNKISALVITDGLTGLYTRTYFIERLQEEIERANSNNLSMVIAMIDIDHFKSVNDKYGHIAGDMLLRQIADILRKRFREIDIIARYGGEEFTIFISQTAITDGFAILEEIRKNIENEKFFLPVESYHPIQIRKTISIGLAELNKEKTTDEIIQKADLALYKAKNTGRNKTCIYTENK